MTLRHDRLPKLPYVDVTPCKKTIDSVQGYEWAKKTENLRRNARKLIWRKPNSQVPHVSKALVSKALVSKVFDGSWVNPLPIRLDASLAE